MWTLASSRPATKRPMRSIFEPWTKEHDTASCAICLSQPSVFMPISKWRIQSPTMNFNHQHRFQHQADIITQVLATVPTSDRPEASTASWWWRRSWSRSRCTPPSKRFGATAACWVAMILIHRMGEKSVGHPDSHL